MDNLAHSLVGLAVSKAGLERLSPATSAVCLIAANAPDADLVTLAFGRWTYLHHHRGITHSIVGTFFLALLIPILFLLADKAIARFRGRPPSLKLKGLLIASVIASASHPFMDWTNNYGVRPLLPWSAQWFYGDLVFIIDPLIWLVVGGAVFLLTSRSKKQLAFWVLLASVLSYLILFGVASRPGMSVGWFRIVWIVALLSLVVLSQLELQARWQGKIALVSLGLLVCYWFGLAALHQIALGRARTEAIALGQRYREDVADLAAMPTLLNPFYWQVVVETNRAAYRFDLHLIGSSNQQYLVRHERPESVDSPAVSQAVQTEAAKAFLEFARFPVANVAGADCTTRTLVQLADLRYTEPGKQRGSFSVEVPVDCPANTSQTR